MSGGPVRRVPADGGDANDTRPEVTGCLTIDLTALRANYRLLAGMAAGAECAAVIKADAYGTGARQASRALAREGCTTFFVATPDEATTLREVMPEAAIYILDGLFPGAAPFFAEHRLRPVLGSLPEIEEWADFCKVRDAPLPAAIHIDTGMNRLGLSPDEVEALAAKSDWLGRFELALVMSHLACADEADSSRTEAQRLAFETLKTKLPAAPASLANSAGIMDGARYHYEMVRAGVALYGGRARAHGENPMVSVVRLEGRIAQVRTVAAGQSVGYGAAQTLTRPTRIATVTLGYADGFFRLLGASDAHEGATAYIGDHAAPLIGRVSMDLVTLDVTDVPPHLVTRGAFAEFIGPHVSIDDIAAQAHTIGYEVLTSLGTRVQRVYLGE